MENKRLDDNQIKELRGVLEQEFEPVRLKPVVVMEEEQYKAHIKELREILKQKLETVQLMEGEFVKLNLDKDILEEILFDSGRYERYFAIPFKLMKKIDLSDVSFDYIDVRRLNFSGSYGIKINPQTVWNKDLEDTILKDVEIIGPFDECKIKYTNFTGSRGAKINPQTIRDKEFYWTILTDVEIIGPFDGCNIYHSDFTGSCGAKINPQTLKNKSVSDVKLRDAEIIGPFDGCIIYGYYRYTDFCGSIGAKINPQTIFNKDFTRVGLSNVEIIGPFDGCTFDRTYFAGSRGAIVNADTIDIGSLRSAHFCDAEITGSIDRLKEMNDKYGAFMYHPGYQRKIRLVHYHEFDKYN